MSEPVDPHLLILIDLQKQQGVLLAETAKHSQMLLSLDDRVREANSKTAKNVTAIEENRSKLSDIKDKENIFKGKMIIIIAIASALASIAVGILGSWLRVKIGL